MNSVTALIVEDDPHLNLYFTRVLQVARYTTVSLHDGSSALAALEDRCPDLLILDLNLPGRSGVDLFRAVEPELRAARTAVVVATADPWLASALAESVYAVLIKPISYQILHDLASHVRDHRSATPRAS